MNTKNINDIEIDECRGCNGIWFDRDELRSLIDQTDQDLNWMDFELWKHKDRFQIGNNPKTCVHCEIQMVVIEYDQTGIEIDYCQKCEGIWLNEGEFEKIVEQLTSELLTMSFSEYLKATLQEAKEIITGPERFISEWRDFLTVLRFLEYRVFIDNPKLRKTIADIQRDSPIRL
jgi:Zn-finger nucleic acid-binding protein